MTRNFPDAEKEHPVDGDDKPLGGTNRLSGPLGLFIAIAGIIALAAITAALFATFSGG